MKICYPTTILSGLSKTLEKMMLKQSVTRLAIMALVVPLAATVATPNAYAEIKQQQGETCTCTYESKCYSEGAKVVLSNGTTQLCRSDGTWLYTKPTKPNNNKLPGGTNKVR
jgi:hypothetical protein